MALRKAKPLRVQSAGPIIEQAASQVLRSGSKAISGGLHSPTCLLGWGLQLPHESTLQPFDPNLRRALLAAGKKNQPKP